MPVSAFSDTDVGVLFFFTPVNIQFSKILSCFRTAASRFRANPEKLRSNPSLFPLEVSLLLFSVCLVGLGRVELPTSPLSGVRSNQLSYRPSILVELIGFEPTTS